MVSWVSLITDQVLSTLNWLKLTLRHVVKNFLWYQSSLSSKYQNFLNEEYSSDFFSRISNTDNIPLLMTCCSPHCGICASLGYSVFNNLLLQWTLRAGVIVFLVSCTSGWAFFRTVQQKTWARCFLGHEGGREKKYLFPHMKKSGDFYLKDTTLQSRDLKLGRDMVSMKTSPYFFTM